MAFWLVLPVLYLFGGLLLAAFIARNPKYFWHALIASTVGTVGLVLIPRPPYSVAAVDELFFGCVVLGIFLAVIAKRVVFIRQKRTTLSRLHIWLFFALIFYMFFESARGFLLWQNILLLRWLVFYSIIGAAAFIILNSNIKLPSGDKILKITLWSSLAYFAVYLGHGFFNYFFRKLPYYSMEVQGVEWSGPGYAVFALTAAMPAALFFIKKKLKPIWLSWAVIATILLASVVYDTRIGFIGVALFFLLSPSIIKWRYILAFSAILLILCGFYYRSHFFSYLEGIGEAVTFSYQPDAGRWAIISAAINAVSQTPQNFLFGYGIHSHHYILGQYMLESGHAFPGGIPAYVRVTGFGSLMADLGFVGIFLLAANFILAALAVIAQIGSPRRLALLGSLLLCASWLLFSKVEDIVLLWFLIMPGGLLVQMAREKNNLIALPAESKNNG